MRTKTVGSYSPDPAQGNNGRGPGSGAGAGLGLVSASHSVFNPIKLLIFSVSIVLLLE